MRSASGLGLATVADGVVLDVWYPAPTLGTTPTDVAGLDSGITHDELRGVEVQTVRTIIDDLDAAPGDTADAYLRLHLLSARLAAPRSLNLDGIFASCRWSPGRPWARWPSIV